MKRNKPILVVASFEKGRGSGHLVRCGLLVRDLRNLGREAALCLPGLGKGRTEDEAQAVLSQSIENLDEVPLIKDEDAFRRGWDFVVFDRFSTPAREIGYFLGVTPVIGIDEGGPERPRFDFLLDLLPSLPSHTPPNALRPDLLRLPSKRKTGGGVTAPLKILVSFGGEDAAGLGAAAARACAVSGLSEVTLISGALNRDNSCGEYTRLPFVKNLRDRIAEYDIVITHFGLCVFEALHAGVPVLLVSPGRLHEGLARNAGFISAGRGNKAAAGLTRLLFTVRRTGRRAGWRLNTAFLERLAERCTAAARRYKLDDERRETLAAYIDGLEPEVFTACPLCGQAGSAAAARFADRTYRRCTRCGILYMSRNAPPDIQYTEAYFFENYKKQYGKTYLEDFPNLTAMARRRLALIKGVLKTGGGCLLDIGCAYGAFLASARDTGFTGCAGIDVSAAAVEYTRGELKINAARGFFPDAELPPGTTTFDVITLWYVIEHFKDVKTVLEKIRALLNSGGILAFSTPNSSGVSGLFSRKKFLRESPADHWTVWDARNVKKVLLRFGFSVKKIVITGHHPERFPFCRHLSGGRGLVYKIVLAFSKLFRLGDTFEVYARKI
ncbi:MAG: methyltransferase domain-containing protein [Treponema sp.]|nr:methyltransferase domain-containing protein [Treponema sp.]